VPTNISMVVVEKRGNSAGVMAAGLSTHDDDVFLVTVEPVVNTCSAEVCSRGDTRAYRAMRAFIFPCTRVPSWEPLRDDPRRDDPHSLVPSTVSWLLEVDVDVVGGRDDINICICSI